MNILRDIIDFDEYIYLNVINNVINIKVGDTEVVLPLTSNSNVPLLFDVLEPYLGDTPYYESSDIEGSDNKRVLLRCISKEDYLNLSRAVINSYVPYLAMVACDMDDTVLIRITYHAKNESMVIHAGLMSDLQVVLFEIHR